MKWYIVGTMQRFTLISFSLAILALAGCSPETISSASKDAERNAAVAQREGQKVERKLRPVVAEAKKQVKPSLQKLDLGGRATAALKLNRELPSTIRVDADTNGIRLRGTVHSEEQKALAERIARDTLPQNATLKNELEVVP